MHGNIEHNHDLLSHKPEEMEFARRYYASLSRQNLFIFRRVMHENMISGWWQKQVAEHLMEFWADFVAGKRPVLVLQAPPQHGKTEQVIDFLAWAAGKDPGVRTIFTSYSNDLGVRVNLSLQRMIDSPTYRSIFPNTKLNDTNVVTLSTRWLRNSSILEYMNQLGSFRNTTVLGAINGQGLDLGVVDDPIKGRAEAQSLVGRNKVWSWMTDDFFGRFSNRAAFIMIMTRWHKDDPVGRWIEFFPNTKVLRYPALAEEDERYRKAGEPLFPKLKSKEFLLIRKGLLTTAGWESIYQQNPIVAGGDMFPVDRFNVIASVNYAQVKKSVRYVDKAGSKDKGAYTAAVLMHLMLDGTVVVDDVLRGQWAALERETRVKQAAQADKTVCKRYQIWVEQEPGSGGKESVEATIRNLQGFEVKADKVTGDKETRAEPYAAQVQGGQVYLKAAPWNRDFMEEHETFPNGKYKDQVDAAAGAFAKLVESPLAYDITGSWIGGDDLPSIRIPG